MRKKMELLFLFVSLALPALYGADLFAAEATRTATVEPGQDPGQDPGQNQGQDPGQDLRQNPGHRTLRGVVDRIAADSIFVKTEEGTIRNFSVKSAKADHVKGLKAGDRVDLELDEGNQIIAIQKTALSGPGGDDQSNKVTGTVINFDSAQKVVKLKTQEGAEKSYKMKDAAATKMNNIKKGTEVVMEVDPVNNMAMDVHVE